VLIGFVGKRDDLGSSAEYSAAKSGCPHEPTLGRCVTDHGFEVGGRHLFASSSSHRQWASPEDWQEVLLFLGFEEG